jgi:hypothetical protein
MPSNGFKYLEIKNWGRYQVKDRKARDIRLYIKDYCAKDIDDPDYNSLSAYQRYVWDACCRIRGRSGRNLHADIAWLARAMGLIGTDRPRLGNAIDTLIAREFLIPSNQAFGLSDSDSETDSDSDSDPDPEREGTGAELSHEEPPALSDSPTTKEEQAKFKSLRLGEWEKGILTRMVDEKAWRKKDVDLAMRTVITTPEAYPDGIAFPAFQSLVEAAAMVVRQ